MRGSVGGPVERHDSGPHAALHRTADEPLNPPPDKPHAGPAQHHRRSCRLAVPPMASRVYTNGIDAIRVGTRDGIFKSGHPTGGMRRGHQSGHEEGATGVTNWSQGASVGGPRHPGQSSKTSVTPWPPASRSPMALSTSQLMSSKLVASRCCDRREAERDPAAARVVWSRRVPRPRLCRHGQHQPPRSRFPPGSTAVHWHALLVRPAAGG